MYHYFLIQLKFFTTRCDIAAICNIADIDECASSPCLHSATCNDEVNKHNCSCEEGYTGEQCETGMRSFVSLSPWN